MNFGEYLKVEKEDGVYVVWIGDSDFVEIKKLPPPPRVLNRIASALRKLTGTEVSVRELREFLKKAVESAKPAKREEPPPSADAVAIVEAMLRDAERLLRNPADYESIAMWRAFVPKRGKVTVCRGSEEGCWAEIAERVRRGGEPGAVVTSIAVKPAIYAELIGARGVAPALIDVDSWTEEAAELVAELGEDVYKIFGGAFECQDPVECRGDSCICPGGAESRRKFKIPIAVIGAPPDVKKASIPGVEIHFRTPANVAGQYLGDISYEHATGRIPVLDWGEFARLVERLGGDVVVEDKKVARYAEQPPKVEEGSCKHIDVDRAAEAFVKIYARAAAGGAALNKEVNRHNAIFALASLGRWLGICRRDIEEIVQRVYGSAGQESQSRSQRLSHVRRAYEGSKPYGRASAVAYLRELDVEAAKELLSVLGYKPRTVVDRLLEAMAKGPEQAHDAADKIRNLNVKFLERELRAKAGEYGLELVFAERRGGFYSALLQAPFGYYVIYGRIEEAKFAAEKFKRWMGKPIEADGGEVVAKTFRIDKSLYFIESESVKKIEDVLDGEMYIVLKTVRTSDGRYIKEIFPIESREEAVKRISQDMALKIDGVPSLLVTQARPVRDTVTTGFFFLDGKMEIRVDSEPRFDIDKLRDFLHRVKQGFRVSPKPMALIMVVMSGSMLYAARQKAQERRRDYGDWKVAIVFGPAGRAKTSVIKTALNFLGISDDVGRSRFASENFIYQQGLYVLDTRPRINTAVSCTTIVMVVDEVAEVDDRGNVKRSDKMEELIKIVGGLSASTSLTGARAKRRGKGAEDFFNAKRTIIGITNHNPELFLNLRDPAIARRLLIIELDLPPPLYMGLEELRGYNVAGWLAKIAESEEFWRLVEESVERQVRELGMSRPSTMLALSYAIAKMAERETGDPIFMEAYKALEEIELENAERVKEAVTAVKTPEERFREYVLSRRDPKKPETLAELFVKLIKEPRPEFRAFPPDSDTWKDAEEVVDRVMSMARNNAFVTEFIERLTGEKPEKAEVEKNKDDESAKLSWTIVFERLISTYKICIKDNIVGQRRIRTTPPKPFFYEQHRFGGQKIHYWCLRLDDALKILIGRESATIVESHEEQKAEAQQQNTDSGGGGIYPQFGGSDGSMVPSNTSGSNIEQGWNLSQTGGAEVGFTNNPKEIGGTMDPMEPPNRGIYGGSGENEVFEKSAEIAESSGELNADEIDRRLEEAKQKAARISEFVENNKQAIRCYMEKLLQTMSRSEARKRVAEVIERENVEELKRVGCL
ncbi:MAG: hypothetical protein ACPL3C_01255 [Pyrobaculum sp.]